MHSSITKQASANRRGVRTGACNRPYEKTGSRQRQLLAAHAHTAHAARQYTGENMHQAQAAARLGSWFMVHAGLIWPACRWHCLAMQRHAGALAKLLASVLFCAFLIDACGAAAFPNAQQAVKTNSSFCRGRAKSSLSGCLQTQGPQKPRKPQKRLPQAAGQGCWQLLQRWITLCSISISASMRSTRPAVSKRTRNSEKLPSQKRQILASSEGFSLVTG